MTWLAGWLKQIIAIILMAGVIDMLLPNKTMQRYVRLIAGLIILLTLLSPIVNLLQGDFETNLSTRIDAWWQDERNMNQYQMPTLQEIERNAARAREQEETAARTVTEAKLTEAMRTDLTESLGLPVQELVLKLWWSAPGSTEFVIAGVQVVLESAAGGADSLAVNGIPAAAAVGSVAVAGSEAGSEAGSAAAGSVAAGDAVTAQRGAEPAAIEDIAIRVDVPAIEPVEIGGAAAEADADAQAGGDAAAALPVLVPAEDAVIRGVQQLLQEKWLVPPYAVSVVKPQAEPKL
jgi:stage III sporulation protein AF